MSVSNTPAVVKKRSRGRSGTVDNVRRSRASCRPFLLEEDEEEEIDGVGISAEMDETACF